MDDIRRQDARIFLRELLSVSRLLMFVIASLLIYAVTLHREEPWWPAFYGATFTLALITGISAYNASLSKRFLNRRYEALWMGCQDRLERFTDVLKRARKSEVGDLREMPETVRRIAQALYVALRRADLVAHEVLRTERDLMAAPPAWSAAPVDPQSRELYRIADKNIAEYRQQ